MKLMRWIAMLAAVLTATSAYAQDVTTSGTKPVPASSSGNISGTAPVKAMMVGGASSDTTRFVLPITSDGTGLKISDNSRDRDNVLTTQIIGGQSGTVLIPGTGSDSSGAIPIDVHAYRYLKLVFFISLLDSTGGTALAATPTRFAYQVRENINNQMDSLSTAACYHPLSNQGVSAAITADTTIVGQTVAGTASVPWSGETVLYADIGRAGGGVGAKFSYPTGMSVMLQTPYSQEQYRYISVRLRFLSTATSGITNRAVVRVWLLGWS